MKKKLYIILLVTALIALLGLSVSAFGDDIDFGADFGGGGGGLDFGGGDWGGDSGGSINLGSLVFLAGNMDGGSVAILVIIIIIVFVVRSKRGGKGKVQSGGRPVINMSSTKQVDEFSLQTLQKLDPSFSRADIEAKVKNWYLMFESSWCGGDMSPARPFLSDGLFNMYQSQLSMMKQNGEAARSEDIAVTEAAVESWREDGGKEFLNVWLRVKLRTYKVKADNPDMVIKGDKFRTYYMDYRWQLMRSAGNKSGEAGVRAGECPNCGAHVSMNQSGRCEYCGGTLSAKEFDFVLNKVDKLQQTSH